MSDAQDPVETLVLEYLQAQDEGRPIDVETMAQRLDTEEQRTEFRGLCRAAAWAEKQFPEPLRAAVLVAGRYRLLEHVGSGGYGKVWRARDEKLARDVALKLFHALREDEAISQDLQREQRALADLRHDGIVRLLDSGKHGDAHFLAMDFVAGRGLDKVLAELAAGEAAYPPSRERIENAFGPPGPREASRVEPDWCRTAVRLLVDVLWALSAAHAHGVVHRDLKPGNVLLRSGGRPVLVDFGLAGTGDGTGDVTGRLFGTVAYLAPEQILQARTGKDELTDVYQAGLLLYELLTLRRAFREDGRTALLAAVARGGFEPPRRVRPSIPRELEDVVLRALEREPARRYASAEAMRDDLERWLDGALPRASRAGAFGRVVRAGRQLLARHLLAASLFLVAGLGLGAIWAMQPPSATVVERLGREACLVDVDGRAGVMLWERSVGADGELRVEPRATRLSTTRPAVVHEVAAGRHRFEFAPPLDGAAGTSVVAKVIRIDEIDDYQRFCAHARELVRGLERGLARGELAALRDELRAPGRGEPAIGDVDVDELFR